MTNREVAVGMAQEAEQTHRAIKQARKQAAAKFAELRAFCRANGIDYEEVRTEAKGHGPNEERPAH